MLEGWGYDEDLPGAENWYRAAAESGSMAGVFGLGMTYVRMGRFTDGAKELQLAVSRQYRPAHNALAYLYATGKGVPKDRERALALWRLGASAGHLAAKKGMVWALIHGWGGFSGWVEGLLTLLPTAWELGKARRARA
jgi:TPR repeat protein